LPQGNSSCRTATTRSLPHELSSSSALDRAGKVHSVTTLLAPFHPPNWPPFSPPSTRVCRDGAGSFSIHVPRTCEIARAATGRPCRLGRTAGRAPTLPQQGESDPEQSVERSQNGSSPLSLEGRELKAKRSILHRHGRMTAEEESRQTKQEQGEGRHGLDSWTIG